MSESVSDRISYILSAPCIIVRGWKWKLSASDAGLLIGELDPSATKRHQVLEEAASPSAAQMYNRDECKKLQIKSLLNGVNVNCAEKKLYAPNGHVRPNTVCAVCTEMLLLQAEVLC